MEQSFKFFSNRVCQYFPCHKTSKEEDFNCLFCYCPLYLLEDCGGNKQMWKGIKDCSGCMVPHNPSGYDYINGKIKEANDKKKAEYQEQAGLSE